MAKILTFSNGVLVDELDDRTVSQCKAATIDAIKQGCADAIAQTGVGWMVEREISGGKLIPADIKAKCAEYRARSNDLEAQVSALAANARGDDDKSACDFIQQVIW